MEGEEKRAANYALLEAKFRAMYADTQKAHRAQYAEDDLRRLRCQPPGVQRTELPAAVENALFIFERMDPIRTQAIVNQHMEATLDPAFMRHKTGGANKKPAARAAAGAGASTSTARRKSTAGETASAIHEMATPLFMTHPDGTTEINEDLMPQMISAPP